MAIQNYVDVYGLVRSSATVKVGEISSRVMCPVTVIRGERDWVSHKVLNQYKYASFYVMTEDPEMIEIIKDWKEQDVVRITGFIATMEVDKKATCQACGAVNHRRDAVFRARSGGNLIYVYPIYASKVMTFAGQEQGKAFSHLIKNMEISTRVFLMGNLVRDPERNELAGKIYTRFQLAINRKFCAKGLSDVRERTDYPWVYSYGENAEKDFAALKSGSTVYVDGALQCRRYEEKYICQECGEEFAVEGKTLEVVSYATEYLSDYDTERLEKYRKYEVPEEV